MQGHWPDSENTPLQYLLVKEIYFADLDILSPVLLSLLVTQYQGLLSEM